MILYQTVFVVLSILGFVRFRRAEPIVLAFTLFFLVLFMGTRYQVGCDYTGYLFRFIYFDESRTVGEIIRGTEPGFDLLVLATKSAGLPYNAVIFLASAIIVVCYGLFLRKMKEPLAIVALLLPVMVIQLSMSGLRQALAVAFLLLAAGAFIRKSRWTTALWIIVAGEFHTSAFLFLPIAFLAGRDVTIRQMILSLLIMSPLVVYFLNERIEVYSDRYIEQVYGEMSSGGALFRYVLVMIPFLFFPFFSKRIRAVFPETFPLMRLFAFISFATGLLVIVNTVALHRMNYYLMPFSIILFLQLVRVAVPPGQVGFARTIPFLVYGGYMTGWLALSRHADACYIPYRSVLLG